MSTPTKNMGDPEFLVLYQPLKLKERYEFDRYTDKFHESIIETDRRMFKSPTFRWFMNSTNPRSQTLRRMKKMEKKVGTL